ncbi:DUF1579 domain-containing protein [bacterium]|nr:DUF1579 domain-containing protein [bacterium]
MKKIVVAMLLSCTVTPAFASDQKMDAKKQEAMKAWMQYATPGQPHQIFKDMAGKYTYTSKFWESSEGKPHESKGSTTLKLILGGRFLQNETKGKAMGMPFEGFGLTGYDNLKKKYDTIWLDSMATGVMHGTGSFDESSKTLKDSGTFTCPESPEKTREYRAEWKFTDKDHATYTMWAPDKNGKEFKNMEMVFTRKQ